MGGRGYRYDGEFSAGECGQNLWRFAVDLTTAGLNQQAGWQTMQSELLALSSQSQHLIAATAVTTSKWKSQMPSLQRS